MSRTPTQNAPKNEQQSAPSSAPRVCLSSERLHFVSHRKAGPRHSPRLRLTGGLVGRR